MVIKVTGGTIVKSNSGAVQTRKRLKPTDPDSNPTAPTRANARRLNSSGGGSGNSSSTPNRSSRPASNSFMDYGNGGMSRGGDPLPNNVDSSVDSSVDKSGFTPNGMIEKGSNAFERFISGLVQGFGSDYRTGAGLESDDVATSTGNLLGVMAGIIPIGRSLKGGSAVDKILEGSRFGVKVPEYVPLIGKVAKPASKVGDLIQKNTKNFKETAKLLKKFIKNPAAIGALLGALGTYPWDAHLKSDNLVGSLSIANRDAREAYHWNPTPELKAIIDETEQAMDELENPDLWRKLISLVPGLNVIKRGLEISEAVGFGFRVSRAVTNDRMIQLENGESDSDFYARIDSERRAQKESEREADAEYYAEVERQRLAAKAAERKADEEYWAGIKRDQEKNTRERDAFDEDYWNEYYKQLMKVRDNSAPSNLKFGLL